LFRVAGTYFEKLGAELIFKKPTSEETPTTNYALLQALERTRTSLAVLIAAETKLTPPILRQYYLETADAMRRCIKKLRRELRNGMKDEHRLVQVLEELHNLPQSARKLQSKEMLQMCRHLQDILAIISPVDE